MRLLLTLLLLLAASDLEGQRIINSYAFGTNSTLNNGLVAYWKMDEVSGTRIDSAPTGSPQDLVDVNTVTSVAGKIGNAAFFTAANQELLSHTDTTQLSVNDSAFTISAWVKHTTLVGDQMIAAHWTVASNERSWRLWFNSAAGRYTFSVSPDGISAVEVSATLFGAPATNTWYLVAGIMNTNANTISIAMNGTVNNSLAHATGIHDSSGQFMIGARETSNWMDGQIDEVGFWNRVLTTAELSELYNASAGRTCCNF